MSGTVAVIIPNWNGASRLERCLASVGKQAQKPDQVLVVDNGSTDNSAEVAARAGARFLPLGANRGFAAAVNAGVREAGPVDYVVLLNNDVVLDAGWLAALVAAAETNREFALFTGRTLRYVSRDWALVPVLDGAGDALARGLAAVRLGYGRSEGPPYDQPRAVLAVCFAAALVRSEVFARVGGLEERFFAYLEDVEFCLRAQLAGFRALYVPEPLAYHEGSATSGGPLAPRIAAWLTANQLLLAARYARGPLWPRVVVTQTLWAARMLRRARLVAWLRGVLSAMRRWRALRSSAPAFDTARLAELLRESEAQIYQDRGREDWFWRAYFAAFPFRAGQ